MGIRKQVTGQLQDIDYVSFDIFDTLVFRTVRTPAQIFDRMYKAEPELFPEHINCCKWRYMRIYAEKQAKEHKKNHEITLSDIYRELPDLLKNRTRIKELELETETKNTYLNPDIENLLIELKSKYNKKIILTSDMYLPKDHIVHILCACGLQLSLIDDIFVSSEWGARKENGQLFKCVSDKLGCGPERILHIGDNWRADYLNAKKAGWRSIYYPLISEAEYRYPYLAYEAEYCGDICNELYAMRILAADHDLKREEKEWFETGAMILGPLLTYAAEWVLDLAERNGISNIYPMMREGYFLTLLLKNGARERKWEGHIEPVYLSRRSLYPALNAVIKKKDIESVLHVKYMTVEKVTELFGLDIKEYSYLHKYRNLDMEACKDIFCGGVSLYQLIKDELTKEDTIRKIRMQDAEADEEIWNYFAGLGMDKEDYITFDIGWKGTSQNAIERIAQKRKAKSQGLHLLVIERIALLKNRNLNEGADIRGFASGFVEQFHGIRGLLDAVFELFFVCREGTTIGYRYQDGKVRPVCEQAGYEEHQLRMAEIVQKGILRFQKVYFSLKNQNENILNQDGTELLKIIDRFMVMPTKKEAKLVGTMIHDENFGTDKKWRIVDQENVERYRELGYNEFTHQKYARPIEWYYGMEAMLDGLASYKRTMFCKRHSFLYEYAMYVERVCRRYEKFVLVGAGMRAKTFLMFLNMTDETERIEFIADNDSSMQGESIGGKRICPVWTKAESNCFCLTTMQKTLIAELKKQLLDENPNCIIYDIYS